MCKYQRVPKDNSIPMCIGTNQPCTYCVNGNMQTYKDNKKKQIPGVNGRVMKAGVTPAPMFYNYVTKQWEN